MDYIATDEKIEELTRIDNIIYELVELKKTYDADCVKVYFETDTNYCIKVIKGGTNIKTFRKKEGEKYFDRRK